MSGATTEVVHLLGQARPGDPVTAAARAMNRATERGGWSSRIVAADRDGCEDVTELAGPDDLAEPSIVVHSVDGGESLAPALSALTDRPVTLLHHGSSAGSRRGVLRSLRAATARAVAATPAAREELRALGFGRVEVLDATAIDGGFHHVRPDAASVENLQRHPGPLVLSVGPLAPGRGLELLLDAFAQLVTRHRPSATLSLCGPGDPWYLRSLRRRLLARGLLSCELLRPTAEAEVLARLDHATAVVALHPADVDPYLQRAARRGVPVVAPVESRTASLLDHGLVAVPGRPGVSDLAGALAAATEPPRAVSGRTAPEGERDRDVLRALGIR